MFCRNCGKEIDNKAAVCIYCGAAAHDQSQQPVINVVNTNVNNNASNYIHKKKWTAFWLCLLLGFVGAHRFYVGKVGTGIIWLLSGGLCGIGWLLDLIVILCGGFKDKAGQPLL